MQSEASAERVEEVLYLAGHASLGEFLGFIANQAVPGTFDDPARWTADWKDAAEHLTVLAYTESGYPDGAKVLPLPEPLAAMGEELRNSTEFRRAFPVVQTTLAVVELDRLIVCQRYLNLDHVRRIQANLPAAPTPEDIFNICLPRSQTLPPIRQFRGGHNSWIIASPARGIRVIDTLLTEAPPEYQALGPTAGICGAIIGYASAHMNVIQAGQRLILNNGTHRALALLEKGITRVPVAIQQVNNPDELMVVGLPEVVQNAGRYLQATRPPLVKDYLNPKLCRRVQVPRLERFLKITIQTEEMDVPLA
jgi:hypothetical protein